jgi:hypothetical protein
MSSLESLAEYELASHPGGGSFRLGKLAQLSDVDERLQYSPADTDQFEHSNKHSVISEARCSSASWVASTDRSMNFTIRTDGTRNDLDSVHHDITPKKWARASTGRGPVENQLRCGGILSPTTGLRLAWDTVIVVITMLAGVIAPLVLVYYDRNTPLEGWTFNWLILLHTMDLFWLGDIVMNFCTGFFSHGDVVLDPYRVAKNYARGWLFLDILALWPLAFTSRSSSSYYVACIFKFPRLLQLGPRFMALQSGTLSNRLLPLSVVVTACQ